MANQDQASSEGRVLKALLSFSIYVFSNASSSSSP